MTFSVSAVHCRLHDACFSFFMLKLRIPWIHCTVLQSFYYIIITYPFSLLNSFTVSWYMANQSHILAHT